MRDLTEAVVFMVNEWVHRGYDPVNTQKNKHISKYVSQQCRKALARVRRLFNALTGVAYKYNDTMLNLCPFTCDCLEAQCYPPLRNHIA